MKGCLLFAHGARDQRWALPFEKLLASLRQSKSDQVFELGFLEFMSPNLEICLASLIKQNCTEIILVPLFMSSGGHVKKDVILLIEQAKKDYPHLDIKITDAIGEFDVVIQAMATVIQEQLL